ncbi:response regulator [Mesoflavibacter zeaxanthinifaciens]|uniref:response regulator n=1 Tax=Mesoflavibacter zeaxanthinifaciens TaxID=393060 RepID=UPI003A8D4569
MFSKVIVADDLGSINQGVSSVLSKLGIDNVDQVQYCDDAYLKIKRAILDNDPYQLLITDLSFKGDHREPKLASGVELVETLHEESIDIKIIVYSIEDRLQKVRNLFLKFNIYSYVCKGRNGLSELTKAIEENYTDKQYISPLVENALSPKIDLEVTDYDIDLIKQLSRGISQEQISEVYKQKNISPSSLSSIEKKINKLKDQFKANNTTHLVTIVKDMGLI